MWEEFEGLVIQMAAEYPRWRRGQVIFNMLMDFDSEAAEWIRGNPNLDPFHNDLPLEKDSPLGQYLIARWKEPEDGRQED